MSDYTEYKDKYAGYSFKIEVPDPKQFDPTNEVVEVRLTTKNGQEYYVDFVTTHFIDYIFEKNKRTKECAKGTYFCMPNMILVEEISESNVRATIDDLIDKLAIEKHFKKMD